jgi:hypothetical protein
MSLPNYQECEYSLFVSYAHDDDDGENGWVQALKDAIWRRLSLLDRDIPRHNLHLSGVNGPAAGRLGTELEENLRSSFGMLIVVGPKYVSSGWCEKELELFDKVFGQDGFRSRLFIAAMTDPAIQSATTKPNWLKLVPADQIYRGFFRQDLRHVPLVARQADGHFSNTFWEQASALGDSLIEEIQKDWSATGEKAPSVSVSNPPLNGSPPAGTNRLRVLVGATTGDLKRPLESLQDKLSESDRFEVTELSQERVSQWETPGELGDALSQADIFIAPFSDAQPLNPNARPGGHLAIEQIEWQQAAKGRPIFWYRPLVAPDATVPRASEKHREFINGLSPVYASAEALEAAISGRTLHRPRVTIYIEKSPKEKKIWKPLGARIGELWEELNRDEASAAMNLDIRTRALDIDRLTSSQTVDDADGVVLLLGQKHPESLIAQINRVEDSIPIRGPVFPGFVALLVPPRTPGEDHIGEHGWDYYKFRSEIPPGVRELDAYTEDLKQFLRDIREQHRNRAGAAT